MEDHQHDNICDQNSTKKAKYNEIESEEEHKFHIHDTTPFDKTDLEESFVETATPDFIELARRYPSFEKYLIHQTDKKSATIDFTNDEAVRELNKLLLLDWFGIQIELPQGNLCPTALSRTKYIRWIHKLLEESDIFKQNKNQNDICGIDIGTGASCIYPLLGSSIYKWKFVATDIDDTSLQWAWKNVQNNMKQNQIFIARASSQTELADQTQIKYDILKSCFNVDSSRLISTSPEHVPIKFHFSMCNPPFFANVEEKESRKDTTCLATSTELATFGGEVEFVKQMVDESVELKDQIIWFTTLLGRKISLKPIKDYLFSKLAAYIETGEISQGKNTRWLLAWTFQNEARNSLVSSKSKNMIRYNSSSFVFDTDFIDMTMLVSELTQILQQKKISTRKTSPHILTSTIYEDCPWIVQGFKSSDSSTSKSAIGPIGRPKQLFQVVFEIVSISKKLDVKCTCKLSNDSNSTIDIEGIIYDPRHLFGLLVREIKFELS